MEQTITTTILKDGMPARRPTLEALYNQYSGMLFSYILQFIPDRAEAGELLADVFARLAPELERGISHPSSIYCWLQVEARKIVLAYLRSKGDGHPVEQGLTEGVDRTYYFSLLTDASPEHRWVFRELFIFGRDKEYVARRSGRDPAYVSRLLQECLLLIRKNLG